MNIKDYLADLIEYGVDFNDLQYELEVENWPEVNDENGDLEPLDLENFEWLSIEDEEMIVACGGDWQEPMTLTIKMIDGELIVTDKEEGYSRGLTEEEFYEVIGLERDDDYDEDYDDDDDQVDMGSMKRGGGEASVGDTSGDDDDDNYDDDGWR